MTECLVAMPLLLGACIGVLLIGRLHDIESQAIATARYDGFRRAEMASAAAGAVDRHRVLARTWTPSAAGLRGDDQLSDRRFRERASPNWRVPLSDAPLIARASDLRLERSATGIGGAPGVALETALGAARAVGALGAGSLDLQNDGLISSLASARVSRAARLPPPLDRLDLELTASTTLLTNAWSASGPRHVVRRVEPLMPSSGLRRIAAALTPVQLAVSLIEPDFRRLCFGHVDVEIVPPDRLAIDPRAPRGAWRPACR